MKSWGIFIEGREHTDTAIMAVAFTALFLLLAVLTDKWADLPVQIG